jgi:flagellar motor switch/type III secretory pathway protein FliN
MDLRVDFPVVDIAAPGPPLPADDLCLAIRSDDTSAGRVVTLPPSAAFRCIDQITGRPAGHTTHLSPGGEGALLYLADRVAGDWMRLGGGRPGIRGFLADTAQIREFLGGEPDWCVTACCHWFSTPFFIRIVGCTLPPVRHRRGQQTTDRADRWTVDLRLVIGRSVLRADELPVIGKGDVVTLDELAHPLLTGRPDRFHLECGSFRRRAAFAGPAQITIVDGEKEDSVMIDESEHTTRLLTPAQEATGMAVCLQVEAGRISMTVGEALALLPGQVLRLDRPVSTDVALRAGDRLVATGELVQLDNELAVRIRELH